MSVSSRSHDARARSTVALGAAVACALLAASCSASNESSSIVLDRDTTGCIDGDRDAGRRGTECLCCHTREFSVAGSIDPTSKPVRQVIVEDGFGHSAVMSPDSDGNFFRHDPLVPPLRARIVGEDGRVAQMASGAEASCNRCHGDGGSAGRLRAP